MKAVILARVSTLKQDNEGLSLREIQLPALREYAIDKELEVVEEFVFNESADLGIRNKYQEMIEFVKANPEVKAIIAFRVDRVTRNFRDHYLADELMREYDKEFHFVHDRLVINKDTVGRDIQDWDTKVYLGKQYINRLREDAINTANYKLSNGEYPGKAPWGMKNVAIDKRRKTIVPDGIKAEAVKAMFEWYATGTYSLLQIKNKLEKEFTFNLGKSQIDRILRYKFYHGVMSFKGKEYKHQYETLITEKLYNQAQKVRESYGKKSHHKYAGLPFIYRGLITCEECGCTISPERKKGGKYIYYKCTEYKGKHGAERIHEEEITRQLVEAYKEIQVPQWVADEITQTVRESHESKKEYSDALLLQYQKEQKKYKNRLEKMYEDKLDGLITAEEYSARFNDYKQKQADLKDKMDQLDEADEEYYKTTEMLLMVATKGPELFEDSEMELKRLFVKLTLPNLKLKGSNLVYDWIQPFKLMSARANHPVWLPGWDSNLRPIG